MFQFQIGTIGSESAIPVFHSLGSFNSRLVRLVENADRFIPGKFIKFQFQIGTIGRAELVREGRGLDLVSIPDWYDW